MKDITVEAKVENIDVVTNFVNDILEENCCPMKIQMQIDVVIDEIFGNISYYKNRYEILSYLGEKRKNSNSIIRKEISLFAMGPCILAIITSLVFILITIKMRGFNYFEIITSAKIYISIMLAFLLVYGISTFIVYRCLIKEIGGK